MLLVVLDKVKEALNARVKGINLDLMSKTYVYSFIYSANAYCVSTMLQVQWWALGIQTLPLPSKSLRGPDQRGSQYLQGQAALVDGCPGLRGVQHASG